MLSQILIGIAILFNVCFSIGAEEISSANSPRIFISEELWDLGTITQGELVTHTFIIKNSGSAELSLDKVRPSCGCLATFTFNRRIPPGESTELKVTFDSKGYRGNFEKYIYIDSNDPDTPHKVITIKGIAKVLPKISISVEPDVWSFIPQPSEQPSTFQFTIENRGNNTLKVSSIETPSDLIDTSMSSGDIGPYKTATVTVTVKPQPTLEKENIFLRIELPFQRQVQSQDR